MALQIKNIIREEIDKFLLMEYMAVWRDDAITQLSIKIANDFAPLNMKTHINPDKEFKANYSLFLGNDEIPILVTYKIYSDGTDWNGTYKGSERRIILHLYGRITAEKVLSGLYHEITHALDARLERTLEKNIGYHFGSNYIRLNGRRSATCEAVNNILYRLWTFTERNAYQSHSMFGIKFCQTYINELKDDIDYLATHTNKNEDVIFNDLKNELSRSNRLKNSNWKTFKRHFIKKSYDLLDKFSRKLINNAYKAQQDGLVVTLEPNENSDIFQQFKKENDSVEMKRQKAREERQRMYDERVNNAAAILKEFMAIEDTEVESAFGGIVEGVKNGTFENEHGVFIKNTPTPGEIAVVAKDFCRELNFYVNGGHLELLSRCNVGGYNKDYFLIFEDDDNTFIIGDKFFVRGKLNYEIRIYSFTIIKLLTRIASNCYTNENGLIKFDVNKMANEIVRTKGEFISAIKNSLNSLYNLLIKHEYTLTIKLKDREVNLSAPTQDELAMKLRNEFPKWNDSVINNWISKATMT